MRMKDASDAFTREKKICKKKEFFRLQIYSYINAYKPISGSFCNFVLNISLINKILLVLYNEF